MNRTTSTLAAAAILAFTLAGCTPAAHGSRPTSSSSPSSSIAHSATDSPTPSASPVTTPSASAPTPAPVAPSMSASDLENIAESISSGNTAALEGYLTNPVTVLYAASDCCGPQAPVDAIGSLDYVTTAPGPWTFPLAEATINTYRAGFYAQYFPAGAYVGQSSGADPFVVSFTIANGKITTIFVSAAASLLLE